MAAIILATSGAVSAQEVVSQDLNKKTFPVNNKVLSEKVHFYNRFGIQIVGDMYYLDCMRRRWQAEDSSL